MYLNIEKDISTQSPTKEKLINSDFTKEKGLSNYFFINNCRFNEQ